jgi:hypothetical protein
VKRRGVLALILSMLNSQIGKAYAQQDSLFAPAQSEEDVYVKITIWFRRLLISLDDLATIIDKQRFLQRAAGLTDNFRGMILSKRSIATRLVARPLEPEQLKREAKALEDVIDLHHFREHMPSGA